MKKIGIITSSCAKSGTYGRNYGAALQGYALIKQLRNMGFDAHDINYVSDNEYTPQQYNIIKRTFLRIKLLSNIKLVKNKINEYKNKKNIDINKRLFEAFIRENDLTYNNGRFYNIFQLSTSTSDLYAVITGSDVVWNPVLKGGINDKGSFLDFAKEGVKRIAYAPSFGVTDIPDTAKKDLKPLLEKFDAISVREKSGADIIYRETGMHAQVVLDPTLLLEPKYYDDVTKTPEDLPSRYMAVYRFGDLKHTADKIREISEKCKLPIVYIPSNNDGLFEPNYSIGPGEFLGVIKNAELVLSDSFHCTVFALINHRPFLTFYRTMPEPGKDINSRMTDLLKTVEMSDRLVRPGDEIRYDKLFDVNFDNADEIIRKMRKESLQYLKNALEVE